VQRRDVIVIGAGAMGSAAAWELSRRGRSVTVLEPFTAGHDRGSSHGGSRIFRLAYPDPVYVRLAQAALPLWEELEEVAQVELLSTTGGVDHGSAADVAEIVAALDSRGVSSDVLAPAEARERWPGMRFDEAVLFQPGAGRIYARATLDALETCAERDGAEFRFNEKVLGFEPSSLGLRVRTPVDMYEAPVVIVAAGAWVTSLLADLVNLPPLKVTQEQILHFPARDPFEFWPSFVHHSDPVHYGLLTPGEGVKVAEHHTGTEFPHPDERDGVIDPLAALRVVDYVSRWFPGLDPDPVTSATCLYTSTPSHDFIVDRVGPLVVASPCSGHGFKFTPIIGKLLADLVDGRSFPELKFRLP
jgi:sarcosine oxidase